jgi:hypothetical protein
MEDLFGALPNDPKVLIDARVQEKKIDRKWINHYNSNG